MPESPHGRPTICFIDHEALRWNLRQIRERVGSQVKILAMVKANGYGHGAAAVAQTLAGAGTDAFGVATLEEGIELRRAGIRAPVLVLAGAYDDQVGEFLKHSLTPVVHDLAPSTRLEQALKAHDTTNNVQPESDTRNA